MTSQSYFIISGALTTELNDLHGATFPNSDDQEATRAIRIKEVEQAQLELDALYRPDYTNKKAHWKIESRDLSHAARINHFWFLLYSVCSLEDAKNSLDIEKRDSHSLSAEFRIVRVETSIKEFVETVWRGLKIAYIIAMTTLIDLSPYWNEYSNEWEVSESDERGNTLEVYGFNTEDDALNFINEWIEKKNLTPA